MSRASRIIVADADAKNAGLLAFGFEREGMEPLVAHAADVPRVALAGDVDGVVLSLAAGSQAAEAMKALKAAGPMVARLPVLALGDPAARFEILGAGVTDFLPRPHFVRDVVALARFHTLRKTSPTAWAGELGDFAGIFYLIRGLSSVGRTGVLTIVRSLRRAELRFYEGEVTSAQVGSLHGMAALHQVLLWTEGKIDFRAEAVVRRQQIPLAPQELIDDLGRFLRDFHELAPDLGPGVVLEQDLRRVAECVDKIPKEVNPVLRLFDGARMLSDIVEDSPFRVFETVKIAARLCALGAIKPVASARQRGVHAALKVDDWLVGTTPAQGVPAIVSRTDSEPVGPRPGVPASPPQTTTDGGSSVASARQKKKAKKEREREGGAVAKPAPVAAASPTGGATQGTPASEPAVDWGRLPGPASSVWDLPGYAPVVPSQVATGEISSIARPEPDANLATAGKVVAQDLSAAAQAVTRQNSSPDRAPAAGEAAKVQIDAPGSDVAIRGTARERVDEISAPVPHEIAPAPAQTTRPGPAPAPTPPTAVLPRARLSIPQPVIPPVASPAAAAESRMHVEVSHSHPEARADSHGVVSGVLSGAVEARGGTPLRSEPEVAEKIVVVDHAFDPPRPPSVEIEIVRAADDDEPFDEAAAEATQPHTPAYQAPPASPTTSAPMLRNIADEEPSEPAAARMPNILRAPAGLAPVVPVAAVPPSAAIAAVESVAPVDSAPTVPTVVVAAPAVASAPIEPTPEAVVMAAPSAPTAQMTPAAIEDAVLAAAPAPVVTVPPALLAVPITSAPDADTQPSLPARPAPAVAAAAEDAVRSAADAAQAAARALSFDAIDEEFFNQEHQFANAKAPKAESFDDLDGHAPQPPPKGGFWRRLLGVQPPPQPQRRRRPTTVPPVATQPSKAGNNKPTQAGAGSGAGSGAKPGAAAGKPGAAAGAKPKGNGGAGKKR